MRNSTKPGRPPTRSSVRMAPTASTANPTPNFKWPSSFCPVRSTQMLGDKLKSLAQPTPNTKKHRSSICGETAGCFAGCFETPPYEHRKRLFTKIGAEPSAKVRQSGCTDKENRVSANKSKTGWIPQQAQVQKSPPESGSPSHPVPAKPQTNNIQEFLQDSRKKNMQYLQYLQADSHIQLQRFLNDEATPDPMGQWTFGQATLNRRQSEVQSIYFLNVLVNYMETVQDNVNRIVRAKSLRMDANNSDNAVLSVDEVEDLKELWAKDRDVWTREIDGILKKLHHFRILSKKVRIQIIQISTLLSMSENTQIIHKDTPAQHLYIILKGSAEKIRTETIHSQEKQLINSLYDGEIFGFADQKYDFSVFSREPCILLQVPYHQYVMIQSEFLANELAQKIEALTILPCFQEMPNKSLVPLASLLEEKRVRNGEYIIREGERVKGFVILVRGSAVVLKETKIKRKKQQDWQNRAKGFSSCNALKSFRNRQIRRAPSPKAIPRNHRSPVSPKNYDVLSICPSSFTYYFSQDLSPLHPGHTLLRRAIPQSLNPNCSRSHLVGLSVVSTSNDCVIMTLSCEDVCKIPEYLLYKLEKWCEEHKDLDEVLGLEVGHNMLREEDFKVRLCRQIDREGRTRKNQNTFR